ncbi:MAG: META domain-containing protein [Rhodobacteraceae bacterium]|nr:META domain-containing protein [Paracoccaceae bacterium]
MSRPALPAFLGLLALLACGPAPAAARELAGELYYLPRIALPATAEVRVRARDGAGVIVAEARAPTAGRQVPLPFALSVPAGLALTLEAAVLVAGEAGWTALSLPVAAGAAPRRLAPLRLDPAPSAARLSHLRCGDEEVTFGLTRSGGFLALAGREIDLHIEETAAGARHVAGDDPATWIEARGSGAVLSLDGTARRCHAITPPAAFPLRAAGQEPFWHLEAALGTVSFLPAGGAPVAGPVATAERTVAGERYTVEGSGLAFTLARRICRDAMTGMPHPFAVTVAGAGATGTLAGCGGDPAGLVEGVEWRLRSLEGEGIAPALGVTLRIDAGRASGSTGCNRFAGAVTFGGEGLAFAPAAMTMMACEPGRIEVERRYLDALARVTRFDLAADGALVLYAGDLPLLAADRGDPR